MSFSLPGRTALVTGASAGIGREMARQLARRGCHLVLTARRTDRLEALKAELGGHVRIDVIAADLADPRRPAALCSAVDGLGLHVDLLLNNAGVGVAGPFADSSWERDRELLQINIVSPVELTRRLLPPMLQRRCGHLLFVSS